MPPDPLLGPGLITDLILGVLALELLAIGALSLRARRHHRLWKLIPTIAAGGLLLLAFRSVYQGHDWRVSALLLAGSGLSHGLDLALRWRRHAETTI